jgi:hypothetical protein
MSNATYHWATDAASGTIEAADEHDALAKLIEQGEWDAEDRASIADGAWLMIGLDAAGERLIERGVAP